MYIYLYIQISLNHNSVWINCLHFIEFQIFFATLLFVVVSRPSEKFLLMRSRQLSFRFLPL